METLSLNMVAKDITSVKAIADFIVTDITKSEPIKYKIISSRDGKPIIQGDLKFDTKVKMDAFSVKITSLATAEVAPINEEPIEEALDVK